jgi:hypothetical protein
MTITSLVEVAMPPQREHVNSPEAGLSVAAIVIVLFGRLIFFAFVVFIVRSWECQHRCRVALVESV